MTDPSPSTPDSDLRARVARALAPAYEVEAELGRGGAGIVYRAKELRDIDPRPWSDAIIR